MQEMLGMDKNICGRSGHNIIRQVMNSELRKSVWQVISVRDEIGFSAWTGSYRQGMAFDRSWIW